MEKDGWDIFLDQKFKGDIYLYDSERDSFMMALKALGYSMNTTSQDELNAAYNWLIQCVQTMDPEIVTDEIIDNMAQARKALGLIILEMRLMSCQKMKIWDSICQRVEQTYGQMRWLFLRMRRILSLRMSLFVILQVMMQLWIIRVMLDILHQIKKLRKNLVVKAGDYDGINAYTPRAGYDKDEVFQYDETTRKIIADLWSRVKVAASNAH